MKSGFTSWVRRLLYAGSGKLRPHEQAVLDAWRGSLSERGRELLDAQLDGFDLVQRHAGDKLVSFYGPGTDAASRVLFPLRARDAAIARVTLRSPQSARKPLRATIVIHAGRLHSLEFEAAPPSPSPSYEVERVETLADPLDAGASAAASTAALPAEYRALVGTAPFVERDGWRIHGIAAIRRVVHPEAAYTVLAEREGVSSIALREGDGALVLLDDNDDFVATASGSFVDQLR